MLAFLSNLSFLLFASGGTAAKGSFAEIWETWFNIPGFELWKFVNLFIFVGILTYLLKKPLSEVFKAKRESIRAELIKAEEAKKTALAKLTEIEAKLAGADSERTRILKEAKAEIEYEKARLVAQAEAETQKLQAQATGEIVRIGQVARLQLRRFAVEESIRRAEEKLRSQVNADTDARLIKTGIQAIGGMN
jgi:F-type H+-transporting ATPase subunit b